RRATGVPDARRGVPDGGLLPADPDVAVRPREDDRVRLAQLARGALVHAGAGHVAKLEALARADRAQAHEILRGVIRLTLLADAARADVDAARDAPLLVDDRARLVRARVREQLALRDRHADRHFDFARLEDRLHVAERRRVARVVVAAVTTARARLVAHA